MRLTTSLSQRYVYFSKRFKKNKEFYRFERKELPAMSGGLELGRYQGFVDPVQGYRKCGVVVEFFVDDILEHCFPLLEVFLHLLARVHLVGISVLRRRL